MSTPIKAFLVLFLVILLGVAGLDGPSFASLPEGAVRMPPRARETRLSHEGDVRDVSGIIAVLESRIKNHHVPERVKAKLAAMNDEEIRIISLLCDRMSGTGDKAGADFAFFLLTAVIVMS
jgi:hypothetical protein